MKHVYLVGKGEPCVIIFRDNSHACLLNLVVLTHFLNIISKLLMRITSFKPLWCGERTALRGSQLVDVEDSDVHSLDPNGQLVEFQ